MSGPPRQPVRPAVPVDELHAAEDHVLAELAREHAEVFGVLYRRYVHQIRRMVFHRLRDAEAADDVTSEVFIKAFRGIGGYRPARAPFGGWLHRIAANAVVDHVRAQRPTVSLAAVPDAEDASVDVEAEILRRAEATRAWRAVAQLCPTQRTAVTLRLVHGVPIAAIAGQMDRSEGAVKALVHRGLSTLREQLSAELTDNPESRPESNPDGPESDSQASGRPSKGLPRPRDPYRRQPQRRIGQ